MIRNPIPWPNGAKCAVAITFDMDADSLIHIAKPEDSHDRLYPISMGRYGPLVALPRILDTYRCLGLKQSFFIPGWCLETYPDVAENGMEPARHYALHGALDGRNPGPDFDTMAYYRANRDVAQRGFNALVHYEIFGRKEKRSRK